MRGSVAPRGSSTSRRSRRRSRAHGSSRSWSASPTKHADPPSQSPERTARQLGPLRRPVPGGQPVPGLPRPRAPVSARASEPAARRAALPPPRRALVAGDPRTDRAARRGREIVVFREDLVRTPRLCASRSSPTRTALYAQADLTPGEPAAAPLRRRRRFVACARRVARAAGRPLVVRARPRRGVARPKARAERPRHAVLDRAPEEPRDARAAAWAACRARAQALRAL